MFGTQQVLNDICPYFCHDCLVVLVARNYQCLYNRTTISVTKDLPNFFFFNENHENLSSSKWRDIFGSSV